MIESGYIELIITVILGGIGGAFLSNLLSNKRARYEAKLDILRKILATKFMSPHDQAAAEALNFVPVIFAGDNDVLTAYEKYRMAEGDIGKTGAEYTNLIIKIALNLGIKVNSVNLIRSPIISNELKMRDELFSKLSVSDMQIKLKEAELKLQDLNSGKKELEKTKGKKNA